MHLLLLWIEADEAALIASEDKAEAVATCVALFLMFLMFLALAYGAREPKETNVE